LSIQTLLVCSSEFEENKGVIRVRAPKNYKQEEFEDSTVVISGRTPKKDRQKEF
jgi:hypothetical protein